MVVFNVGTLLELTDAPIGDLTNVNISNPVVGQVLKYNGTAWINDTDAT